MKSLSDNLSHRIRNKAIELHQLSQAIKASLPTDCHPHVEVAGIRDNQLVILTDSPVWQTRLRMYSQSMLETLHQYTGTKLTRVKLKLAPAKRIIADPEPAPRTLSQDSASIIQQTANCIENPELQAALQRLSQKAKKP